MIGIELVDVVGVGFGDGELAGRAVRYSDFPHRRTISRRLEDDFSNIDMTSCANNNSIILLEKEKEEEEVRNPTGGYADGSGELEIPEETRNPGVESVLSCPNAGNREIPVASRSRPELVPLNKRGVDQCDRSDEAQRVASRSPTLFSLCQEPASTGKASPI